MFEAVQGNVKFRNVATEAVIVRREISLEDEVMP